MDSYSGSEPRKFISFHLGEEKNGQPTQEPESVESTTESLQTSTERTEEVISADPLPQQAVPMDQRTPQLQCSPNQSLVSRIFGTDSSGSNDGCGTYITCKMSQTEEAAAKDFAEVTEMAQRESIREAMELAPEVQQFEFSSPQVIRHPKVVFLDPPGSFQEAPDPKRPNTTRKRPRISPPSSSSTMGFAPIDQTSATVLQPQSKEQGEDDSSLDIHPPFTELSESEFERASDSEIKQNGGSTLADALKTAPNCTLPDSSDQSSIATPVHRSAEPREAPLEERSRAMIKEHFEKSERFRLPGGHPIVAFTESQISTIMRVVADETARASFDMLENLVYRASRLSLAARPSGTHSDQNGFSRRGSSVVTRAGRGQRSSTGGYSDASGAIRSDEDLESIGYSSRTRNLERDLTFLKLLPFPAVVEWTQGPHSHLSTRLLRVADAGRFKTGSY